MMLLKWMFDLTYCECNGQYFVLGSGPIRLGAIGEIAIIYMEEFQIRVMNSPRIQIVQERRFSSERRFRRHTGAPK